MTDPLEKKPKRQWQLLLERSANRLRSVIVILRTVRFAQGACRQLDLSQNYQRKAS